MDKLKIRCNKILPLVYDNSLSYYEAICKLMYRVNDLTEVYNDLPTFIASVIQDDDRFRDILEQIYVDLENQIDNLDYFVFSANYENFEDFMQAGTVVGKIPVVNSTVDVSTESGEFGLLLFAPNGKFDGTPADISIGHVVADYNPHFINCTGGYTFGDTDLRVELFDNGDTATAINAMIQTGVGVLLGGKNYTITHKIVMNTNDARITGVEPSDSGSTNGTIIYAPNTVSPIIDMGGTWTGDVNTMIQGLTVKNLTVSSNNWSAGGADRNIGISMHYTLWSKLENVKVRECNIGYYISGCVYCRLVDCKAFITTAHGNPLNHVGFALAGSSLPLSGDNASVRLVRCLAQLGGTADNWNTAGFEVNGRCADTFFTDCETVGQTYGFRFLLNGQDDVRHLDITLEGCVADQSAFQSYSIVGNAPNTLTSMRIVNCYGANATTNGEPVIRLANVHGVSVIGCTFEGVNTNVGMSVQYCRQICAIGNILSRCTYGVYVEHSDDCEFDNSARKCNVIMFANTCVYNKFGGRGESCTAMGSINGTTLSNSITSDVTVSMCKVVAPIRIG